MNAKTRVEKKSTKYYLDSTWEDLHADRPRRNLNGMPTNFPSRKLGRMANSLHAQGVHDKLRQDEWKQGRILYFGPENV